MTEKEREGNTYQKKFEGKGSTGVKIELERNLQQTEIAGGNEELVREQELRECESWRVRNERETREWALNPFSKHQR